MHGALKTIRTGFIAASVFALPAFAQPNRPPDVEAVIDPATCELTIDTKNLGYLLQLPSEKLGEGMGDVTKLALDITMPLTPHCKDGRKGKLSLKNEKGVTEIGIYSYTNGEPVGSANREKLLRALRLEL